MERMSVDPEYDVRVWEQLVWEFEIAHVRELGASHGPRREEDLQGELDHAFLIWEGFACFASDHSQAVCPSQGVSLPCTPTTTTPASHDPAPTTSPPRNYLLNPL